MPQWAYGITTTPEREKDLLPRTVESLRRAGFAVPWLFIDGCRYPFHDHDYERFACTVVSRYPRIGAFGSWVLALWELWVRYPQANYYALFQDDLVCVRDMREYIEASWPTGHPGYLNLYTTRENAELAQDKVGWFPSNQMGRGALALVFNRMGLITLLQSPDIVLKPSCIRLPARNIDGAVITAMKKAGFWEWCHYPSLVEHTGVDSVIGNHGARYAPSFPGEDYRPSAKQAS